MPHTKSQSNAYDLCAGCKHYRHLHTDKGCNRDCTCKGFVEVDKGTPPIEQQIAEYEQYFRLLKQQIEIIIPQIRHIDKGYGEEVARNLINTLDKEGWVIRRKTSS